MSNNLEESSKEMKHSGKERMQVAREICKVTTKVGLAVTCLGYFGSLIVAIISDCKRNKHLKTKQQNG